MDIIGQKKIINSLINHYNCCNSGSSCNSKLCNEIKDFFEHENTCRDKNCNICKKLHNIKIYHSLHCNIDNCKVRDCKELCSAINVLINLKKN